MRSAPPLLTPLFRSEAQARMLSELLLPDAELSVTELAGRTGSSYPTVHRELSRLRDSGLLVDRRVGNSRLYKGNPDSPLLAPVRAILLVVTGPVALLRQELAPLRGIECAFLFGSFAARAKGVPGPPPRDIDLMVIGDPTAGEVYRACRQVSEQVGRTVNPTIMTEREWHEASGFVSEVRNNPVIEVQGDASLWLSSV